MRLMTTREWIRYYYQHWYGCRHGRHVMKFSGCVYCGGGQ
jgi:hypothetical protein